MKKFITVLTILFLASITYTASAQYISRRHAKTPTPTAVTLTQNTKDVLTPDEFLQSDIYQDALSTAARGRKQVFSGIMWSTIGAVALGIGAPLAYDETDIGGALVIAGGICVIAGTVLEICGVKNWATGEAELRNLRFEYSIRANGLVISF